MHRWRPRNRCAENPAIVGNGKLHRPPTVKSRYLARFSLTVGLHTIETPRLAGIRIAQTHEWRTVGMLVLSRKIGEKIHVGKDITIEVRRVAGNRVTLAVDAPRDVRILRGELKEAAEAFE